MRKTILLALILILTFFVRSNAQQNPAGSETFGYNELSSFKLFQNYPNPAKETTYIKVQVNTPGLVSLKIFDMLGNSVFSVPDQNLSAGVYSIPVETQNMSDGVYFYVFKKGIYSQTMKMIVSK